MSKYGLQLRQPKKPPAPARQPLRPPAFAADDDDDVEQEISRQASKNKALQKIEEQHKKAMEEDPSVFDYDGVYDEMKEKIARPKLEDKSERVPKYIHSLKVAAEKRQRNQEIVFERKLLKERSKDDHLYADKEKFVTRAYKEKLLEEQKWLEEERKRQILEEKEDVTKKKDLSDFYFSLSKNVAFGARVGENAKPAKDNQADNHIQEHQSSLPETEVHPNSSEGGKEVKGQPEISHPQSPSEDAAQVVENTVSEGASVHGNPQTEQTSSDQRGERYKRSEDALAAARERFLARKRAREQ
ncbi:coiled-coil domain-containing protein 55 [Dioscorea alata]|uniref:Coiled-coil domain-containing protein 55 n=3 Tax=Dioscorea alata TaxID=55571 RepID=A0ACB7VZP6_DIOAL|nr:coiled-coil domain-containing protein 55 [Dioscorea alata]KAH7680736.1 coiled-coil domain-containing protein 55 [Dioscorea alata]KAH7680737.1 coiled-coil domain-containing protein 55 [Dioscorea alata]